MSKSGAALTSHHVRRTVEVRRVVHFQSVPFGSCDTYQRLKLTSSDRYSTIQIVRVPDGHIFPVKLLGLKPSLFILFVYSEQFLFLFFHKSLCVSVRCD